MQRIKTMNEKIELPPNALEILKKLEKNPKYQKCIETDEEKILELEIYETVPKSYKNMRDFPFYQANPNKVLEELKKFPQKLNYLIENEDELLILAAQKGYLEVVKLLVENGANIHAQNNAALELAIEKDHAKIVEYFKSITD